APKKHNIMTIITLRKATRADRQQILAVERQSTPGLQYLPYVFEMFLADKRGEFSVAEIDGEVVACAKFTTLPDNSAWLETIRVTPARQGLGIGKRFYENYFAIAKCEGISTMRMYTGIGNAVSKGLAERFGFQLAETFYGASFDVRERRVDEVGVGEFRPIFNPTTATNRIMPHAAAWGDFLVMNRTFYKLTPDLCADLARRRLVYANADSLIVLGARFMPDTALHIGLFAGQTSACLKFANQLAAQQAIPKLSCLFPITSQPIKNILQTDNWAFNKATFIVMEVDQ
ncbi:MAG: GNAT family N-acetyltransferase, partial [Candidatus Promineifilaceae bacterium]